jgi:hypothetical protein
MHHKAFPIPFERTAQSADVMTNPALTQPWAVRAICSLIPKHRNAAGQETPPVEPLRRHSAAAVCDVIGLPVSGMGRIE